jgi:hypothetical protein
MYILISSFLSASLIKKDFQELMKYTEYKNFKKIKRYKISPFLGCLSTTVKVVLSSFLISYLLIYFTLSISDFTAMAKFLYPFWVEQHLLSVMKTGSDITQNTFYMFLSQAFRCLISYYNTFLFFF